MKHLFLLITLSLPVIFVPAHGRAEDQQNVERESRSKPDFQRHVVPLLGRLGCNSAKCHGSFQGQGGFRLSLFGFDFDADHRSLLANSRVVARQPEKSLILKKPTGQLEHEGGVLIEENSAESQLLARWIANGALGISTGNSDTSPSGKSGTPPPSHEHFRKKVRPLLETHCYECHGYNNRKGGLSLANRDQMLLGGESGPAIVAGKPEASLLVKAVGYDSELQMPPSGKLSDVQIADLQQWIEQGAVWPDSGTSNNVDRGEKLSRLRTEPREIQFASNGEVTQVRVIAEWENGDHEDVTDLARFQTNNDAVARVTRDGVVSSTGPGDTHIIAFYDNGVAAIPTLRRYTTSEQSHAGVNTPPTSVSVHEVDRLINAKLDKLGLVPSELCSDSEFLRRVSIDLTGTLPTPEEVQNFVADDSDTKRVEKIDELLSRSTYAAWWANKLCDFTGCNPKSINSLLEVAREEGYVKASEWYDWIYEAVDANTPYDELVEGIMLADLSGRDAGMPYFWTRQSLKEPKDTAMSVAHAFLGIQLQCAECHKHPFDRWTQADFNDFAHFFDSVTRTKRRSATDKSQGLRLLRSGLVNLESGDDPRRPVMKWMRSSTNPWFAQAFVNRVWAGYFNIGIVEPPDQFTPANPPSNPELLAWLTDGFIREGYDMKWLHRQIVSSDTYQRSWKPNATNRNDRRNFSRAIPRRIPAEVVYDAMKQATAASDQQTEVRKNLRRRASGHLSMRMAGTHAMKVFGKPDRSINCDCERVNSPTLLQAIFTQNDPLVRMRIADSGWVIEIEEAEESGQQLNQPHLIQQVWLRTVGRSPSPEEEKRARSHLKAADSVAEGIADLLWALMNTKEFLLNH